METVVTVIPCYGTLTVIKVVLIKCRVEYRKIQVGYEARKCKVHERLPANTKFILVLEISVIP